MFGLLRQWQALESWAAAGKLGVLRALVREDDQSLPGGGHHGDPPEGWTKSLTHEVALALSGRDLPTDQTLAAHASVCSRAQQYQESGAFPDDTRMDQYRAAAYLDLLNGIPAAARIASGQVVTVTRTASADDPGRPDANCPPLDDDGPGNGALEGGVGGAGPGDDTGGPSCA